VLIFETGDEIISELQKFAREQRITAAHFTAIGALSEVTLAWFDWEKKDYRHIPVHEQVEVLTLTGDVAEEGAEPKIHAHIIVGKADGSAHGGHLIAGRVRPTLELILEESPVHLRKRHDPATGLALINV
jgi:predicted DNA-binding protein with PD1-like motif